MSFSSKSNYFDFTAMHHSVGKGCTNKPLDVLSVQHLLNGSRVKFSGRKVLKTDGLYGANTLRQILLYQKEVVKLNVPDGVISPNRNTHKSLASTFDFRY